MRITDYALPITTKIHHSVTAFPITP
jgi:hypothetical protein